MNPSKRKKEGEEWLQPCSRFEQVPQALVIDILSRLSVKTLFGCRCVCKSWLSIISDSQFVHLQCSRSPTGILIKKPKKARFSQIEQCAASDFWVDKMRFTPMNNTPLSEFDLINSCNGLLYLHRDGPFYVCNPILGEFITIPPFNTKLGYPGKLKGLGFSARTNEYKVLRTFYPLNDSVSGSTYSNYLKAEIYTISTGVCRSIGNAPWDFVHLPFNAFLHGALHWVSNYSKTTSKFIRSFNFEIEQFQTLPYPSYFGPTEKEYVCGVNLVLGVLGGCLVLSVFAYGSSKFDIWVMKDYGVQDSWTKTLVVENLYPRKHGCNWYEPIMFLNNGEILMFYNGLAVVCYDQETKSFSKTKIAPTQTQFHAIAYSPCFVSLYDVSKEEEVKRIRDSKKSKKLFAEGDCAGSGMPLHKSTKLNSGYVCPAFEEDLAINSSPGFTWRIGSACTLCGGHLGYVFRGSETTRNLTSCVVLKGVTIAGSGMPSHKSTNLNFGYGQPARLGLHAP